MTKFDPYLFFNPVSTKNVDPHLFFQPPTYKISRPPPPFWQFDHCMGFRFKLPNEFVPVAKWYYHNLWTPPNTNPQMLFLATVRPEARSASDPLITGAWTTLWINPSASTQRSWASWCLQFGFRVTFKMYHTIKNAIHVYANLNVFTIILTVRLMASILHHFAMNRSVHTGDTTCTSAFLLTLFFTESSIVVFSVFR